MKVQGMGVLLVAAGLMLAPLTAGARVGVYIGVAPPAPVVETVPVAPGPGYVWQGGYYNWDGAQYVWVPGAYVVGPHPGAFWVPGHWRNGRRGYHWVPGHWR